MLCTEGFGAVQQVGNTGREQRQMYLKHPSPWNHGSAVPSGGAGWDIKEDDGDVVGLGAILQQEVTLTQKISSSSSLFFCSTSQQRRATIVFFKGEFRAPKKGIAKRLSQLACGDVKYKRKSPPLCLPLHPTLNLGGKVV